MTISPKTPENNTDRFTINSPDEIKMYDFVEIVDHRTPEVIARNNELKEALRRARAAIESND